MIDLCNAEIKDIMPVNLVAPESLALSYAVGKAMKRLQDFADKTLMCAGITYVPDRVLDLIALELNTQYYEQQLPRATKEAIVSKTLSWYMHAGTVPVLEEFLKTILDGGTITEWFQYDGEPFHFKALVNVGEHEIPLGYGQKVKRQIQIYKNLRSWLEALVFNYRTGYDVPIRYENSMSFRSAFHPRYNLPYLRMDGTWKMDGSRRMSGYDSTDVLDFYPVMLWTKTEVTECIKADSQVCFSDELKLDIRTGNAIEISGEALCDASLETEIHFQGGTQLNIETEMMLRFVQETNVTPDVGSTLRLHTDIDKNVQTAEKVKVCTGAVYQIETASYMTKMNLMDGTWKMDGSRKMDGGRYVL